MLKYLKVADLMHIWWFVLDFVLLRCHTSDTELLSNIGLFNECVLLFCVQIGRYSQPVNCVHLCWSRLVDGGYPAWRPSKGLSVLCLWVVLIMGIY